MCTKIAPTQAQVDAAEKVLVDAFDRHAMPDGYWRPLGEAIAGAVVQETPHPVELLADRPGVDDAEIRAAHARYVVGDGREPLDHAGLVREGLR